MTDPRRAVIFGRDASTYEAARPTYPAAAVAHIIGLVDASEALEVGAGTGKATGAMASPGLRLTCLEPSPQMAQLLRGKGLPGVDVVESTFEDWDGEPSSVDLIYAAQAWHWVDAETGLSKAISLIRPGGAIALMWNIPEDRYTRHEEAYRAYAPRLLDENDERIERRDGHDWSEDMARVGFVETNRFTHRWSAQLTSAEYRALYSTYSDHMLLDEPRRSELLDALAADVEGWGGVADVDYRTEVFSGERPVTGQG